jgi:tRNA G10  N-methylase Trm11
MPRALRTVDYNAASTVPPNPATFSPRILTVIAAELREFLPNETGTAKILDPFAGPGGVHALRAHRHETWGIEIEREWAAANRWTFQGDATQLASLSTVRRRMPFDAIVTSPTYGNRMADHHEAADRCRECCTVWIEDPNTGNGDWVTAPDYDGCSSCGGTGLTRRHTYRHQLGRPLHPRNTGGMQWGDEYRDLHRLAWVQCFDVLADGGLFILNVKDHVRGGEFQGVPGWHLRTLQSLGFIVENATAVATGGMRHGANSTLRADAELVITLRKGEVE